MLLFAKKLWDDDLGVIISAEMALVLTLSVIAMVVGLTSVARAVNSELADLGSAFGAIDQTYYYQGMVLSSGGYGGLGGSGGLGGGGYGGFGGTKAFVSGSGFFDMADYCDCSEVVGISGNVKFDQASGSAVSAAVTPRRMHPSAPVLPAPRDQPCDQPPCQGLGDGPIVPAPDANVPHSHAPQRRVLPQRPLRVPPKSK